MRRILLVLVGFAISLDSTAQTKEPEAGKGSWPGEVEEHVRTILAAKYPYSGVAEGYRALFRAVGPDGLRALQSHEKDGIALQAAWQQVRLTVPEKQPAQPTSPDAAKLAWFVGFLEGRARVQAPAWWTEAVLGAGAHRRDHIFAAMPRFKKPYHQAGLDYATAPLDTTLEREKKDYLIPQVTLRVGKEAIRIREEAIKGIKSDTGHVTGSVSALVTPTRCYLATHDDVGYSYSLSCIDRESGKAVWKSGVWSHFWGAASGQHEMYVTVVEQSGRIFVFGASHTGFHVEAFKADDGANLFRFCSAY